MKQSVSPTFLTIEICYYSEIPMYFILSLVTKYLIGYLHVSKYISFFVVCHEKPDIQ